MDIPTVRWLLRSAGLRYAGVKDENGRIDVYVSDGTVIEVWRDGTVSAQGASAHAFMDRFAQAINGDLSLGGRPTSVALGQVA